MKVTTRDITVTAIGIALYVALSMVIRVPVFENYYLCLGYVVLAVYAYNIGAFHAGCVGAIGCVLYCLITSGIRGMPGWTLGNLFIGITLGWLLPRIRDITRRKFMFYLMMLVMILSSVIGILLIKSFTEVVLYSQPMWIRMTKNVYSTVADAMVLVLSLPLCEYMHPTVTGIMNKKE